MRVLSDEQRKRVRNYKYAGEDHSVVSRYVLGPYWNWLVTLFPLWVAPNLITLVGFGIMVANLALVLVHAPALDEPCPWWVYASCAVGLFAYQSLDSIDGKQARRTGTSSPLGELFDHGCDALNTAVSTIAGASALNLGQGWLLTLSVATTATNFYLSTWEEYHTKVLYLSFFSGPVEGILMAVVMFAVAAWRGPRFFDTPLQKLVPGVPWPAALPQLPLNQALIGIGLFLCILNMTLAARNVQRRTKSGGLSLAQPLSRLQLQALWVFALATMLYAAPALRTHAQVPLLLAFGLAFGHLVGSIILAHLTASPFPSWAPPTQLLILAGLVPINLLHGATLTRSGAFVFTLTRYPLFSHAVLPVLNILNLPHSALSAAFSSAFGAWKSAADAVWPYLLTLCIAPALPPARLSSVHPSYSADFFRMEVVLVLALLLVMALWYLLWAVALIREMCSVFDIYCLSIKPRPLSVGGAGGSSETRKTQ